VNDCLHVLDAKVFFPFLPMGAVSVNVCTFPSCCLFLAGPKHLSRAPQYYLFLGGEGTKINFKKLFEDLVPARSEVNLFAQRRHGPFCCESLTVPGANAYLEEGSRCLNRFFPVDKCYRSPNGLYGPLPCHQLTFPNAHMLFSAYPAFSVRIRSCL